MGSGSPEAVATGIRADPPQSPTGKTLTPFKSSSLYTEAVHLSPVKFKLPRETVMPKALSVQSATHFDLPPTVPFYFLVW